MIKGVNKQIIEVNCTQNETFDKVILFVNPDSRHTAEELHALAREYAEEYLSLNDERPKTTWRSRLSTHLRWLAMFGIGALSAIVVGFWLQ